MGIFSFTEEHIRSTTPSKQFLSSPKVCKKKDKGMIQGKLSVRLIKINFLLHFKGLNLHNDITSSFCIIITSRFGFS